MLAPVEALKEILHCGASVSMLAWEARGSFESFLQIDRSSRSFRTLLLCLLFILVVIQLRKGLFNRSLNRTCTLPGKASTTARMVCAPLYCPFPRHRTERRQILKFWGFRGFRVSGASVSRLLRFSVSSFLPSGTNGQRWDSWPRWPTVCHSISEEERKLAGISEPDWDLVLVTTRDGTGDCNYWTSEDRVLVKSG